MRYLVSFTALTLFIMTTGGRLGGSEKLVLHLILWGYLYCAIATTEKTLLGNTTTPQWRAAGQHTWMGWDAAALVGRLERNLEIKTCFKHRGGLAPDEIALPWVVCWIM